MMIFENYHYIKLIQFFQRSEPTSSRPTEAELEMFKDVWNAPRPAELDIHLDDKKAEEVF